MIASLAFLHAAAAQTSTPTTVPPAVQATTPATNSSSASGGGEAATAATTPPVALAPADHRRQLLAEANHASDVGDHARAIELFQQAGQIEMPPGLRIRMAEEYQTLGSRLLACEFASRGEIGVQADLGRANSASMLQGAADLVGQNCGHFARVRLHLPTPIPAGIRIMLNGRSIEDVQPDDVSATQAGAITVMATVSGERPFRQDLRLREGETRDVTVNFRHTDVQVVVHNVAAPATGSNTLRYVAYVLMGVGGVSLLVGGVELGVNASQISSMANANPLGADDYAAYARYYNSVNANRQLSASDVCSLASNDPLESAVRASNVCSSVTRSRAFALSGLISGGVLVAGGLALFFGSRPNDVAPPSPGHAEGIRLMPEIAAGLHGASAAWAF